MARYYTRTYNIIISRYYYVEYTRPVVAAAVMLKICENITARKFRNFDVN